MWFKNKPQKNSNFCNGIAQICIIIFKLNISSQPHSNIYNTPPEGAGSGYPTTRAEIHQDLTSRGYTTSGPSSIEGNVVYKDPNGARVTIKSTGEVIPTIRLPKNPANTSWNRPMYNQRTFYDGTIIPGGIEGSHSIGHFVVPFKK